MQAANGNEHGGGQQEVNTGVLVAFVGVTPSGLALASLCRMQEDALRMRRAGIPRCSPAGLNTCSVTVSLR